MRRVGFTLIELLVVIAIIGLLISLILVASADGVRRAEERATQALVTKLETALNDRFDALLNTQPPINQTHRFLASINSVHQSGSILPVGSSTSNPDDRRAQVIAQFDYIRAELPDVFFVNARASDGSSVSSYYPLNFAAAPYPSGVSPPTVANFVLPLGNNFPGLPLDQTSGNLLITQPALPVTGMFGASFSAAGGAYKNLYTAAAADLIAKNPTCTVNFTPGYDGIDNNGDTLIDELTPLGSQSPEVVVTGTPDQSFASYVTTRLAQHTHKTARSEMLYAILVEGLSPLGSSFSRDDFTNREVQDTDGDGLPEFIDAWGEPLQFFRWPIYYGGAQSSGLILGTSDSQRGSLNYAKASDTREQDPLDPNQLLVSPGWWASLANPSLPLGQLNSAFAPPNGTTTNFSSPSAIAFMNYFHSLVDPLPSTQVMWDRGSNFSRREYFTKFLILSAGPDREPGVAQFGKDYSLLVDDASMLPSSPYTVGVAPFFPSGTSIEQSARLLLYIENQAAVSDPIPSTTIRYGSFYERLQDPNSPLSAASIYLFGSANSDDITNHNISGISTGVR